jgi:hypothetical protein
MLKTTLFRFENYWTMIPDFMETVSTAWFSYSHIDGARSISAKLKALRVALKIWNGSKLSLKILIHHCNIVIAILDELEEIGPLHVPKKL